MLVVIGFAAVDTEQQQKTALPQPEKCPSLLALRQLSDCRKNCRKPRAAAVRQLRQYLYCRNCSAALGCSPHWVAILKPTAAPLSVARSYRLKAKLARFEGALAIGYTLRRTAARHFAERGDNRNNSCFWSDPMSGLYSTQRWMRVSRARLRASPVCALCLKNNRITAATVCDHITPHAGDVNAFWTNATQNLCASCHSGAKRVQDLRGYSDQIGSDGLPTDERHPWYRAGKPTT